MAKLHFFRIKRKRMPIQLFSATFQGLVRYFVSAMSAIRFQAFSVIICTLVLMLFYSGASAQQKYVLSGTISDSATGETLFGATVMIKGTSTGAATDEKGRFHFELNPGNYMLFVTYIGFESRTVPVTLNRNTKANVRLKPISVENKEVVVTGARTNKNITSTEMSKIELSGEKIKQLPVIFGEPDVLKAITLLPGIKSGGEGGTGFYVRGGGPDQNLVLMDDAVIYNPSHLLGFLSVFNTDAIREVEIIKGGMPANYGGRLSSVLNVGLREGSDRKYTVSGGIGLISSRITVEGPVKRNTSGFIFSARRTYIDQLIKPFLTTEQRSNGYYFYDFNGKMHWYLGPRDKIFFSGYYGRDIFNFRSPTNKEVSFQTGWGNAAATLRWYHAFNNRLFCNTAVIYNRFDLFNTFKFGQNGFDLSSGLQDWNLKEEFQYKPNNNHHIRFGGQYIYHRFTPGIATGQVGTIKINEEINKQYAHEGALFVADEFKIKSRLIVNAGLRGVLFVQVGPYTEMLYDDQQLPAGTGASYTKGEPIVTYPGLEPRLAATYLFNSSTSIKASFTQTYQFLHLATTSGAQFPADLWVPSSKKVKPQLAYQYVLGFYKNFRENEFESSVEAYYKPMYNQIEFRPGAQLFFNQNLENEMIFGNGLSYGIEFFLRKKTGRLNGWVGYTWSRTTRQFDALNGGEAFYFRYDRTHDMSLVISYQFNKRWTGNLVFVYGTGNAATLPTSRYTYEPGFDLLKGEPKITFIDVYDKINAFRLPAYHRMDISATWLHKKKEKFESSFNFSIYNVYNRANPYFIYFVPNFEKQKVQAFMVYLFPILPSVAWNFRFL